MNHMLAGIWIILAPCLFLLAFVHFLNVWADTKPTVLRFIGMTLSFVALVVIMWGVFVILLFAQMGVYP